MTPTATLPPGVGLRADQCRPEHAGSQARRDRCSAGPHLEHECRPCRLTGRPSVRSSTGRPPSDVIDVPISSPAVQPIVLSAHQPVPMLYEDVLEGSARSWSVVRLVSYVAVEPLSLAITLPTGGVLHAPVVIGSTPRVTPHPPARRCPLETRRHGCAVAERSARRPRRGAPRRPRGPSSGDCRPDPPLRRDLDEPDCEPDKTRTVPGVHRTDQQRRRLGRVRLHPRLQRRADDCPGCQRAVRDGAGVSSVLPPSDKAAIVWGLDPYCGEGFPPRSPAATVPPGRHAVKPDPLGERLALASDCTKTILAGRPVRPFRPPLSRGGNDETPHHGVASIVLVVAACTNATAPGTPAPIMPTPVCRRPRQADERLDRPRPTPLPAGPDVSFGRRD